MRIIPSYGCVSTTVGMHHLDSNKMLREKVKEGIQKNAMCCLEQILEATPLKTAVVPPLSLHLINHSSKMNKTCWRSKDELISDVLLLTFTYGCARVGQPAKTSIHQLCENTGYILEDLPRVMDNRDG